MNNRSKRIVGIILLVAFAGWILMTVLPRGGKSSRNTGNPAHPTKEYEPKFRKEGELAFINPAEGDTLLEIDIELAESREEISYGMMYRKTMDPMTGMLFLMGTERMQSFYMKNTYVPLDIIFINDDLEIVSIQKNAIPLDESSLPSEGPASYVLEVIGGFSDQHGIGKGTKIRFEKSI